MSKKIRWAKIIANAGVAFFTSLSGIFTIEAITKADIPLETLVFGALVVAFINAGLSFMKELAKEEEEKEIKKKSNPDPSNNSKKSKLDKVLSYMVFFE